MAKLNIAKLNVVVLIPILIIMVFLDAMAGPAISKHFSAPMSHGTKFLNIGTVVELGTCRHKGCAVKVNHDDTIKIWLTSSPLVLGQTLYQFCTTNATINGDVSTCRNRASIDIAADWEHLK